MEIIGFIHTLFSTLLSFANKLRIRIIGLKEEELRKSFILYSRKKTFIILKPVCSSSYELLGKILEANTLFQRGKIPETEIIEGIRNLDGEIYSSLYLDEYPKIENMILNESGNVDDAKDVFQNALVILIEKVSQKDFTFTSSVGTYLYSISKNLWINERKKYSRRLKLSKNYKDLNENLFSIEDYKQDIYNEISKIIETTGESCKKLLESYYINLKSWDEIAESLGYANAASARNQKYKCINNVRKKLKVIKI